MVEWETEHSLALAAIVLSVALPWWSDFRRRRSARQERQQTEADMAAAKADSDAKFAELRDRERNLKTLSVYMDLEVNSSKIFEYTAGNADRMDYFRRETREPSTPAPADYAKGAETTLNLYYQSLNLFEVCSRMYRRDLFPKEVFGSWVAWFYEIADDWYFQEQWSEIRQNYTSDVRRIFDIGTDIFRYDLDEEDRIAAFYQAVAFVMAPENEAREIEIADWLASAKEPCKWDWVPSKADFASPGTNPPALRLKPQHSQAASSAETPPI